VNYSSTVERESDWAGKQLLASMVRMQLGELLIHFSNLSVHRGIVDEVAERVLREGIAKETIDRCIVSVLMERAIAYLGDRSLDEEEILDAVRELAAQSLGREEGMIGLRWTD
jgi:hypothetical protein